MAQTTCDACGETVTRYWYRADGPWAGKRICRECGRRNRGFKRLSWAATFTTKLAQVLPPNDAMTVPVVRLLMAMDDRPSARLSLATVLTSSTLQ